MRRDRRARALGNEGFTVVEILVVLVLIALAVWLARLAYRALTHHAAVPPATVTFAAAPSYDAAPGWTGPPAPGTSPAAVSRARAPGRSSPP